MRIVLVRKFRQIVGGWQTVRHPSIYVAAVLALSTAGCAQVEQAHWESLNREGVTALARNDEGQAHSKFVEAWKLQPNNADTLYNLATTYHRHGQYAVAEEYYRQSLRITPDQASCRHNYHLLLVGQDRMSEAYEDARRWVQEKPNSADAEAELGFLERQRGDLPAAQTHLQSVLSRDPNQVLAQLEMAKVYESYRMPERAISLYRRVFTQDPHNAEAQERLANLQRQKASPESR
jgi:Tfp pilus assembly protein PilF